MNITKEACVGTYQEVQKAVQQGCHRIELCENLAQGGTTPSCGTIRLSVQYCEKHNVDVAVMIRPRGGHFHYSPEEIQIMKYDIDICKTVGASTVVFGILNEDQHSIDYQACEELIQYAKPLKCVFHMAFDFVVDQQKTIQTLIDLGFVRLLTKGGNFQNATEGQQNLQQLVAWSQGKLQIMAAGGVNENNFESIVQNTGVSDVHGTQIVGKLQ